MRRSFLRRIIFAASVVISKFAWFWYRAWMRTSKSKRH